jgi:hypothetical protein
MLRLILGCLEIGGKPWRRFRRNTSGRRGLEANRPCFQCSRRFWLRGTASRLDGLHKDTTCNERPRRGNVRYWRSRSSTFNESDDGASLMLPEGGGTMTVFRTILRGLTASGWPATTTHQALDGAAQAYVTRAYRPDTPLASTDTAAHGQQLLCVDKV